ncbi:Unsaturated rhamnogalacturonyl hydrolase YteR [Fusobacterium sp. DD29]|uniref:glycoside hydrolase family 88/105 protein n=1 Tax=unclassified Fusobacterium TaxID=2648384 RepID=UPI001B8C1E14|nr:MULTISPECIES: glycoside hydrolase family 88 protein [unclassified Fusobacterium]MBR8748614.1 Unsaturated rhamnogalacturonyl hydrolase YteR [Fusobacterium sp. DD29]MBR8760922.1 Unsaturated rhamnogalacturonyl hydrolase YteR [Fusobacterium sp. DD25]MBR8766934.1 Unsaturated rhamnogalacturonyl hydrolase YteR [Fusobacterium sp. DD43]MBR8770894.1 Unsaturated rhamnogalacturonyl hydrolase YteR [Fusobacterium sp. DD40]MBR8775169.1 Unsaturated rhamnogalacturonyl hydrolase YteR [Fusobacterium sp. DD17]
MEFKTVICETYIDNFLKNYKPYKGKWCYEDGCLLQGCLLLYKATGEKKYLDFILKYLNVFVSDNGDLRGYVKEDYNIDNINAGKVLFDIYNLTKDKKYKKAIDNLYSQLLTHPRTECGNFWHKKRYENQVWLDGLYMVEPFYTRYETEFNNKKNYADIYKHFTNVRDNMFDEDKKLYYHAWDTAKKQEWADKNTGLSKNFWVRAIGWLLMAMIDTLEYMSEEIFYEYRGLQILFKEAVYGVLQYQDPKTHMWYQVVDKGGEPKNYVETSGSLMIAYAMMKGARLGFLNDKYREIGLEAFKGICNTYLKKKDDQLTLEGICLVAGLGNFDNQLRDGSYEYYMSEPVVADDVKGSGIFLMAYSEVLLLNKELEESNYEK